VIYNRASADKTGQRVSVESQATENRSWCEREGWEVAATVTDNDRSATRYATREREGYKRIQAGLATGEWGKVDLLVMWESSRGERTMDGHIEMRSLCQRLGVRLAYRGRVLDMADGDDRFTAGLDALLDEREAERIRDRIIRGHLASVQAGKPRGVVPYGYRREYAPGSGHMLRQIPDPETAPVVQGVVAAILAGQTLYAIAQRLNRDGVLTPQQLRGDRRGVAVERVGWSSSMLRNLLRKRSLMGERTHNGVVTGQGTWEPIVSPEDWRAVQEILADPARARYHGGREAKWLLSGIATCGICGAWLRPMRHGSKMMYVCAGLTPSSSKGHVARAQEPLDAFVVVHVVRMLADPRLPGAIAASRAGDSDRVAATQRRLADLEAQLASAKRAVLAGKISFDSFGEFETELQASIAAARLERGRQAPVAPQVRGLMSPDAGMLWAGIQHDVELQRLVVRELVGVVVGRSTLPRGSRGFDDASVRVTARLGAGGFVAAVDEA
jgi:site-specific DNA recombinase